VAGSEGRWIKKVVNEDHWGQGFRKMIGRMSTVDANR
jgi:hypothetical protein